MDDMTAKEEFIFLFKAYLKQAEADVEKWTKHLERLEGKTEPVAASPLQCGVMPRAFMEECYRKFLKRAKENNRTLQPWKDEHGNYLRDRLEEEKEELFDAMFSGDNEDIMDECLDVANFAWFIYEQAKLAKGGA